MARLLAIATILQWTLAGVFAVWLTERGVPAWIALPAAVVLLIAVHGLPLAIEFVTGALIDRRPGPRLSPLAAVRLWANETWISWRMFGWQMPFRSGFAEPVIARDPQRPAVLLIHGFACNRAVWKPLLESGLLSNCNAATVNLEPVFGAIDAYAPVIRRAVDALRAASGAPRVTLVCHSMGGLAARVYLRDFGADAIERVITIATPHSGTVFAAFGHGHNAWQMRTGSDFLRELGAATAPLADRFVCIGSRDDNLIVPRPSMWLPGAKHITVERIGHLAMVGAGEVHRLVAAQLRATEGVAADARAA
jgi:predicted alpha/beta hydrolase family esterase